MITAVVLLVFALLCLYAAGILFTKLGDQRLSQLSRGALRQTDGNVLLAAFLLAGCGMGFAYAALVTLGWLPHG